MKKIFLALVLTLALLPFASASAYFELDEGSNDFVWNMKSDVNISDVKIDAPEEIQINNTMISGKNISINLTTEDIKEGVYILSAQLRPERYPYIKYNFATVLVDMVSEDQMKKTIKKSADELYDKIQSVNEDLNSQKDKIGKLEQKTTDLEDKISDQSENLDEMNNEIKALKFRVKLLKNKTNETSETENKITGKFITNISLIGIVVIIGLLFLYKRKAVKDTVQRIKSFISGKTQGDPSWKHKINKKQGNKI